MGWLVVALLICVAVLLGQNHALKRRLREEQWRTRRCR